MKTCTMVLLATVCALFFQTSLARSGREVGLSNDYDPVKNCIHELKDYYSRSGFFSEFALKPNHEFPIHVFMMQVATYSEQAIPIKVMDRTGTALFSDEDVAFVLKNMFGDDNEYCKEDLLYVKKQYERLANNKNKAKDLHETDYLVAYIYLTSRWSSMHRQERVMLARWWQIYPATKDLPSSLKDFPVLNKHHTNVRNELGAYRP